MDPASHRPSAPHSGASATAEATPPTPSPAIGGNPGAAGHSACAEAEEIRQLISEIESLLDGLRR